MKRLKEKATPKMLEILTRLEMHGVKLEKSKSGLMQINPDYEKGDWTPEEWKKAKKWLLNDLELKDELIKLLSEIATQNELPRDEEMKPPIKITQDEECLNHCHNFVFDVQAAAYLMKVGLYLYIDKLQIGYDTKTKEITLPLDGVKGSRYFSIRLEFDHAADEEEAQQVLQYYNLKPNETAKWNLYKDADGKLINGGKNYDEPYNELGKRMLFENGVIKGNGRVEA